MFSDSVELVDKDIKKTLEIDYGWKIMLKIISKNNIIVL